MTKPWNELVAHAIQELEPVASAHPDLAADDLLAALDACIAGIVELMALAALSPVEPIFERSLVAARNRIVRARRRAQGHPVCVAYPNCPYAPEVRARGQVQVLLCPSCASLPW